MHSVFNFKYGKFHVRVFSPLSLTWETGIKIMMCHVRNFLVHVLLAWVRLTNFRMSYSKDIIILVKKAKFQNGCPFSNEIIMIQSVKCVFFFLCALFLFTLNNQGCRVQYSVETTFFAGYVLARIMFQMVLISSYICHHLCDKLFGISWSQASPFNCHFWSCNFKESFPLILM